MLSESDSYFIRTEAAVRRPGSTAAQLAEQIGAPTAAVEELLRPICMRDSRDRWWPMLNVSRLFTGCQVRATPDDLDPPENHWQGWHAVTDVETTGPLATVRLHQMAAKAWESLPATQLVIYRPHPMLWAGCGPWG